MAAPTATAGSQPAVGEPIRPPAGRKRRADAERNVAALLEAANTAFQESGVNAAPKLIADRAGVGVGTLYRHFPHRSDLIKAVFRHEVDACVAAAPELAATHPPREALVLWLQRYTGFVAAKHGLAEALHSADPAYDELPAYYRAQFGPAIEALLGAARASGDVAVEIDGRDLLIAISNLCRSGIEDSRPLVAIFANGLFSPAR